MPERITGARRLPVGPSMASTTSRLALPPLKSLRFLPLATITLLAALAISAASLRPSFLLAETVCFGVIFLASRNLDALVQLVQPLRW